MPARFASATQTPTSEQTFRGLLAVARALGKRGCWLYQRRWHFTVRDEWTVAISAESAGRLRVDACRHTTPTASFWVLAGDHDRLAGVVLSLTEQIAAGVAPEESNGGAVDPQLC